MCVEFFFRLHGKGTPAMAGFTNFVLNGRLYKHDVVYKVTT